MPRPWRSNGVHVLGRCFPRLPANPEARALQSPLSTFVRLVVESSLTSRGCGGIGRRIRFGSCGSKIPWRFEPSHPHFEAPLAGLFRALMDGPVTLDAVADVFSGGV